MNVSFNDENKAEFDRLLTRYPDKEAVILPSLHLVQKQYGHVPDEGIVYVAALLGLSPARIEGVATFYTMYNRKAVGKYHVQVCRNIACSVMGSEHLIDHVAQKLGVKPGQTTADGKFTLARVECLGACGTAPVMMVNDDYYESLTPSKVDEILDSLK